MSDMPAGETHRAESQPTAAIADYGLIGNCRAAALVSKYGSIDWCCLPEFDSPAIFTALLDPCSGGYFSIAPSGPFSSWQRYLPDTNVLETLFITPWGKARLLDAFVAETESQKSSRLFPDHEILRFVETLEGTVHFQCRYAPVINYGRLHPQLRNHPLFGIKFSWRENSYTLRSTVNNLGVEGRKYGGEFQLATGEQAFFSLSCSSQEPAILPELPTTGSERMDRTIEYWKKWISQCRFEGLYRAEVKRSALALKLLTHAPSGAIIAAPTTSLPEEIGGSRNWDYRYCWLRDASFTTRVLINLGFREEVDAYMSWILHATQLTRPKLKVVYSVFGTARLREKMLLWLQGFRNSHPVRIGNGAYSQIQLDVYGEVLDAVYSYSKIIDGFSRSSRKFILGLGKILCNCWNQPDNGIWEIRSSREHYTHSKVMAWVGLDRLIKLSERFKWKDANITEYKKVKADLEKTVEEQGYSASLGAYSSILSGSKLDASALTFSLVGFCDASSARMRSTTDAIQHRLIKNGLLYRYQDVQDGISGGEGAFGICNFWLVENLAQAGKIAEARETFERMLQYASPTGLFSEEIDPQSHELIGNYPQGFTHIGLINAAITLNLAISGGRKL